MLRNIGIIMQARMLMRVQHRNIVPFIGYCSDPDNIALVYEFMAYGSLAKHLSGVLSSAFIF